jgi:hypothetical protein
MRKTLLAVTMMSISSLAFSATPGGVQAPMGQMTDGGVNIKGTTTMNVSAEDTTAVAEGNAVAKNQIGGIKGGTNIDGTTTISVNAKGTAAVAKGNATATNSIGVIGGE